MSTNNHPENGTVFYLLLLFSTEEGCACIIHMGTQEFCVLKILMYDESF